ncbi:MAG: gfo/Idh/MocA family oxidoreductase [Pseudonocardiaceae bacterium]|nr:gfo/Idh/MocA family oxidoreductase [Pseudonocardiaceae bacterium]
MVGSLVERETITGGGDGQVSDGGGRNDIGAAAPIRLGVMGCASVAKRRVLPAVTAAQGIYLGAVASRTLSKAAEMVEHFGGEPVHGYQSLLERSDVDAVYIPLPPALRAEWITNALLAGKHVLAEKPLTTSAKETAELVELAEKRRLVMMENFMFPQHSLHATVRRLLSEGTIGTLRGFASTFAIPERAKDDIRYRAELGGGALLDVGGYPLRAAQIFLGHGLEVQGASLWQDNELGVDVNGAALLVGSQGVAAQLSFGLAHAYTSQYRFIGSTGRLAVDHVFTTPPWHQPVVRLARQDQREQLTLPADNHFVNSVELFADAIHGRSTLDSDVVIEQARLIDDIRSRAESA